MFGHNIGTKRTGSRSRVPEARFCQVAAAARRAHPREVRGRRRSCFVHKQSMCAARWWRRRVPKARDAAVVQLHGTLSALPSAAARVPGGRRRDGKQRAGARGTERARDPRCFRQQQ